MMTVNVGLIISVGLGEAAVVEIPARFVYAIVVRWLLLRVARRPTDGSALSPIFFTGAQDGVACVARFGAQLKTGRPKRISRADGIGAVPGKKPSAGHKEV